MTIDKYFNLYAFVFSLLIGLALRRAVNHPEGEMAKALHRWLSSWWMNARWLDDPESRLKRMSWLAFAVAAFLLYLFFSDIPLRSPRLAL